MLTVQALALLPGCERGTPSEATPPDDVEGSAAAPAPWFTEEAALRGIGFVHDSGRRDGARLHMPEIVGGGVALLDCDGDGDLDLYLVQHGDRDARPADRAANRLYLNDGTGRFTDATEGSGAGDRGLGIGVATGDYDGDGDLDLYVTNVGPDVLLRNEGRGRFRDVTAESGIVSDGFGASAAFFDADGDGDLDLFVLEYLVWTAATERDCYDPHGVPDYCSPGSYAAPAADRLFRNEGDGTFTDVSVAAGIADRPGTGLGVVCVDFTGDDRCDVFVANDGMPDHLWVNVGNGTFVERGVELGCAIDLDGKAKAGMGVVAEDADADGDVDLIVCNLSGEADSLFLNDAGRWFDDAAARSGLASATRRATRFGMGWHDFDHDGRLDLYQANGRVYRPAGPAADPADVYAEENALIAGGDAGRFAVVAPRGGVAPPLQRTSRGAAFGDVDGDGDLDVVVANRDAAPSLLINRVADGRPWIGFRVVDAADRLAIGARVRIETTSGPQVRIVRTAWSYLAAHDPIARFGLAGSPRAASIVVRWPEGVEEAFGARDAGAVHDLRRGAGSGPPSRRDAP